MPRLSALTPNCTKVNTDAVVGTSRRGLRLNSDVMRKSRTVFPVKTAHHIADITGYSVRAAERWLSERVVIPSDALAALIQSEWGKDFLAAVMTDNTPKWWLQLKAWLAAIDYAAAERKQRRKLRELLDDAAQMQDSTALLLQDQDFYSGRPAPGYPLGKRR
jgi:hypothetical protein